MRAGLCWLASINAAKSSNRRHKSTALRLPPKPESPYIVLDDGKEKLLELGLGLWLRLRRVDNLNRTLGVNPQLLARGQQGKVAVLLALDGKKQNKTRVTKGVM